MISPGLIVIERVHPTPEQVRAISLFADLDEPDLARISTGLTVKHVPRNTCLFRQGSDADSAFFIADGVLNLVSALPGGGEMHIADIGLGGMLGETSLVAKGLRTATARAETDVMGFSMESRFFHGVMAHGGPVAARILGRLIRVVSERLQAQYAWMVETERSGGRRVSCRRAGEPAPGMNTAAKPSSFPFDAYLPRLGFFSIFQPDEIRLFQSGARAWELPRGTLLFDRGAPAESCFLVIRGALELFIVRGNDHVPLAILGPGSVLGTTTIISGGARTACARVREDADVFEISASRLEELIHGQDWFSLKVQLALCESLIVDLGNINKRAARVMSQISVRINQCN